MIPDRSKQTVLAALGVTAGVATGLWLWRRSMVTGPAPAPAGPERWAVPRGSGVEVAEGLRRDPALSNRDIQVDTIAEGVIELTGAVESRSEAERAVQIAQATTGVYTVVNRLVLDEEENHRIDNLRRRQNGDAAFQERHHYGMGVGMEGRKQHGDTEPDRPSDKAKILERELDVANVEDSPEGGPNPVSGDEAVDVPDMKPGDEDAIREAGLDPSPRPNSTPKQST